MGLTYRLEYKASAVRELQALPKAVQDRIRPVLHSLPGNPRPRGVKALKGSTRPLLRLRVGDYRIVYAVEDERLVVLVVRIAHRREVYR